jgi:hypothetical protein
MGQGTPTAPRATLDVSAAMDAANLLTDATAREEEAQEEGTKYVNLRFRESEYIRLKKVFGGQGFNMTNGCRKASVYIANLISDGTLIMTEGGIVNRIR